MTIKITTPVNVEGTVRDIDEEVTTNRADELDLVNRGCAVDLTPDPSDVPVMSTITAGSGIRTLVKLTQAEYDDITTPDDSTLYVIVEP